MSRSDRLTAFFVSSFAVSGFVEGVAGRDAADAPALVHAVVVAVLCFAWCRADVAERNLPMPAGSAILCGVLPAVGIPAHFFRTRPFRRAAIATAKAIGVFAVSIAVYGLALAGGELAR